MAKKSVSKTPPKVSIGHYDVHFLPDGSGIRVAGFYIPKEDLLTIANHFQEEPKEAEEEAKTYQDNTMTIQTKEQGQGDSFHQEEPVEEPREADTKPEEIESGSGSDESTQENQG